MGNESGLGGWVVAAWVLALVLAGCAGHVDLQQVAKTPDELQALHQFKAEHPEANEEDFIMAMELYRARQLRKQALAIQFAHQYPNATQEELAVLIDDQMAREGPYPGGTATSCSNTAATMTTASCQ